MFINLCKITGNCCYFVLAMAMLGCAEGENLAGRDGAVRDVPRVLEDSGVADPDGSSVGPRDDAGGRPDTAVAVDDSGVMSMFPAFLRDGRTFDQERDYIAWEGPVDYATIMHRDGTSLPPSEGGASCSGGCNENITRIGNGGRVRGRFSYLQSFSVQLSATSDAGAGTAIVEACGMVVARILTRGGASAVPGFSNQPQPAFAVATAGECPWSITAEGGYVDFRAVTVMYRSGAPPTVDVRVDGMNGPVTFVAPAQYLLSWTSTSAAQCVASGSWLGARELMGSAMLTGVAPGSYTYTVSCSNGGGTAMDSVMITVTRPAG
jgi:hypothetical protein